MKKSTIVIVDDHTLVRETWSFILNSNPQFAVIGEAGSGEQGIEMARELKPDVVIMDINLPSMSGIEATRQVTLVSPHTKVLGVSLHTQPAYAKKMIREGASGYVTKSSSQEEMFEAIHQITLGKKYICEEIKTNLSEQMMGGEESSADVGGLSQRENQIVSFIRQGLSSKTMAKLLHISVKTVEVHRYNISKKLNLKNGAALASYVSAQNLGAPN